MALPSCRVVQLVPLEQVGANFVVEFTMTGENKSRRTPFMLNEPELSAIDD
jgi:hypothetical protein